MQMKSSMEIIQCYGCTEIDFILRNTIYDGGLYAMSALNRDIHKDMFYCIAKTSLNVKVMKTPIFESLPFPFACTCRAYLEMNPNALYVYSYSLLYVTWTKPQTLQSEVYLLMVRFSAACTPDFPITSNYVTVGLIPLSSVYLDFFLSRSLQPSLMMFYKKVVRIGRKTNGELIRNW